MVNKKDLAKKVAAKTLLSQKEALQVIDSLIDTIIESLEEDGEVSIVGFGKYYLYTHASRPVRNPKTQEEMVLKPYKSVKFKVSDKIKKHFKKLD
jgi:nucleoid DNA-binding protein